MTTPSPRKLPDVVREVIRLRHYSYRTQQTYIEHYPPIERSR